MVLKKSPITWLSLIDMLLFLIWQKTRTLAIYFLIVKVIITLMSQHQNLGEFFAWHSMRVQGILSA